MSGEHLGHEILSVSEAVSSGQVITNEPEGSGCCVQAKQFRSELAPLVHDAEKVLRNTRKSSEVSGLIVVGVY